MISRAQPGIQGEEPAPLKNGVALAAVKGERTLAELAQQYEVHATQITQWRTQLLESAADIFGAEARPVEPEIDVKTLHAKIGELTLTNDFLSGAHAGKFTQSANI